MTLPQLHNCSPPNINPFLYYRRDSFEAAVLCHTEVEVIAARVTFHPIITTASA
jgi:hypothetical protein